jgi:hypothetical protein
MSNLMNRKFLSFLVVALVIASTSAFASPVVLSNPYDVNSIDAGRSTMDGGLMRNQCFSDFYYDGSYEITDFHWSGVFQENDFSGLWGFTFRIYNDWVGIPNLPGFPVYFQHDDGNANATLNGDLLWSQLDVYDFSLNLTTPWTAPAGKYYFSVYAEGKPNFRNDFHWGLGQNQYGDDDLQSGFGGVGLSALASEADLAWEVTGNRLGVVPEPATMTLFGLGLLGSTLATRRSKNKNQTNV